VDNFVQDGISSKRQFLCLKENYRARKEAGVKTKASYWEALNITKKKVKNFLLRRD